MTDAVERKVGARPRAAPAKTVDKNAAMDAAIKGVLRDLTPEQLAEIGPREGLLRVMRWALRAGALPLFIDIATALMPYMHAKKAPVAERRHNAPAASEIAADIDPEIAPDPARPPALPKELSMVRTILLAGMLTLPLAAQAAIPPSQEKYSVNLGLPPGVPGFVLGQMPFWIDTSDTSVNPFGLPRPVSDQSRFPVSTMPATGAPGSGSATPAYVLDANSAAFQGVIAITPGITTAPQRSLGFVCTYSGPVTLTLADGTSITLGLIASAGFQSLPFAVTNVALGSGTAGSFWGLR